MIRKIVGYGHPALRRPTQPIPAEFPELEQLVADMFETMYNAQGVGLAGPQIDISYRIFVVDGEPLHDPEEGIDMKGFKRVFINAEKIGERGRPWPYEEGCLSIPDLREDVRRPYEITLKYEDQDRKEHIETFTGMKARVVQHEYDHIEGVLFVDYLSGLRRRMNKKRLDRIASGNVHADYPMKFGSKR